MDPNDPTKMLPRRKGGVLPKGNGDVQGQGNRAVLKSGCAGAGGGASVGVGLGWLVPVGAWLLGNRQHIWRFPLNRIAFAVTGLNLLLPRLI